MKRNKMPIINVNMKTERAMTGRLFAHFRLNDLRKYIRDIKIQEGTVKDKTDEHEEMIQLLRRSTYVSKDIDIDPQFGLPYGFGYDDIIKEKTDLIKNNKFYNNRKMDELVE